MLQCLEMCNGMLQNVVVAVCCRVWQSGAVCRSVLQCVAVCFSVLQRLLLIVQYVCACICIQEKDKRDKYKHILKWIEREVGEGEKRETTHTHT